MMKKSMMHALANVSNKPVFAHLRALAVGFVLSWQRAKLRRIEEVLDFAYRFRALGVRIAPIQVPWEAKKMLEILSGIKPRTILEIGTSSGGTLFLFTQVAASEGKIISVDLPGGKFGGGYPVWKSIVFERFKKNRQKLYLVRGDSHSQQTLNKVKNILEDRKLDFLFIDGDHTYGGVKRDFELYAPLVKRGGIIAFHDICPHPTETGCEVDKLWREIKDRYKHHEIVKDWKQGYGIGMLHV